MCDKMVLGHYTYQTQQRGLEDRWVSAVSEDNRYRLYAIYDGHGCSRPTKDEPHVVLFTAKNLHHLIFQDLAAYSAVTLEPVEIEARLVEVIGNMDTRMEKDGLKGGTCLALVLVTDTHIYQVNIGDSVSYLLDSANDIISRTENHDASNKGEIDRCGERYYYPYSKRFGVRQCGPYMDDGILLVSRALGDFAIKSNGGVIATPDVTVTPIENSGVARVLIISDGITEPKTMTDNHIQELLHGKTSIKKMANLLVKTAIKNGTTDDCTAMVIDLTK